MFFCWLWLIEGGPAHHSSTPVGAPEPGNWVQDSVAVPHESERALAGHSELPTTEELDRRVVLRGRRLFESVSPETPSAFDTARWLGKAIVRSLGDTDFRLGLFRFIDVFPALSTPDALRAHVEDYFGESSDELVREVQAGMRDLVRAFIAGRTAAEALATITALREQGCAAVVGALGDAAVSDREAAAHVAEYLGLLEGFGGAQRSWKPLGSGIGAPQLDWGASPLAAIAVKPSSVCARLRPHDFEGSVESLLAALCPIFEKTMEVRGSLCLDQELYEHKGIVLEAFKRLRLRYRDYPHLGIVVQSYLVESDDDLAGLIPWAQANSAPVWIRLVKGAYWHQEVIRAEQNNLPLPVYTTKAGTDAAFERQMHLILENHKICSLACGSHNVRSIAATLEYAAALGVPSERYELQLLMGMAEPLREGLLSEAGRVRVYCPYGALVPGMGYLVRRLMEGTARDSFLRQGFATPADPGSLLRDPAALAPKIGGKRRPPMFAETGGAPDEGAPRPASIFRNEPAADFSRRCDRDRMSEAIRAVKLALGQTYPLFIDGADIHTSKTIPSVNPARPDDVVGHVGQAGAAEVERAIAAARRAFPGWRDTDPRERAEYLLRAADHLRGRIWELAAWQVLEVGKQWDQAHADVDEAIDFCRFYASEMVRLGKPSQLGRVPGESDDLLYEGRGVASVIAPWNFPLAISCGMVSAAVVTGNCVVYKPSSLSAVVGHALVDAWREAGLPAGVFNYVPGSGAEVGDLLVDHPEVALIAFTGSLEVGKRIIERAAKAQPGQGHIKKVVAEMGGKNAIIIDDDADLDEAVPGVLHSAFGYQGQKCSACSRVVVLDAVYDRFVDRLVAGAGTLRTGPAESPGNDVGPLVDAAAQTRVLSYIDAPEWADRVIFKSAVPESEERTAGGGFYVPVTIVGDVRPSDRVAQEEIFGPVLSLMRARDFDDALELALSTPYALTGGIFSRSPRNLEKAARSFRVGNLYLNRGITGALVGRQPFGGFGMSGTGTKAGGTDYLLHFMQPRVVTENLVRRGFALLDEEDDRVA